MLLRPRQDEVGQSDQDIAALVVVDDCDGFGDLLAGFGRRLANIEECDAVDGVLGEYDQPE